MDGDENRIRGARDYLTRLMRGTTTVVHLEVCYKICYNYIDIYFNYFRVLCEEQSLDIRNKTGPLFGLFWNLPENFMLYLGIVFYRKKYHLGK